MTTKERGIGWLTCTAIVVANMVGTGVFTSLGYQVGDLPSGFVLLTLWALGAIFALCGALCYAELSAALPRSGGEYNFLSRIYGRPMGFMGGFVSATVGFAAPVTLASMAFGEYFAAVFPGASPRIAATVVVLFVTMAHLVTLETSRGFQVIFTSLKLLLILVIIFAGTFAAPVASISFLPQHGDAGLLFSAPFAVALMYVMYSYSGWNAATYVTGEVRRPGHDVPWGLIAGTLFVGVLYVALNFVFLRTVPMSAMAGKIDVGHLSAVAIFGQEGGRILSGFICAGLISTISAMTWAGPRVMQTIGEDFDSLRFFARTTRAGIPARAVLAQGVFVLVLLWNASFQHILVSAQFALVICGLLTVAGLIVLRIREPELPRPFRCWGYPVTPLLFAAIAGFTLVYTATIQPVSARDGVLTVLLGLAVFYGGRWMRGKIRRA
ncbi:MAG TPA: amino acid permease [Chthoniobacterales bacterium]|nr:amino acid permease [Chthoniobacterales bacterium]